jgi:energy-coupling factor transport system permease protein
VSAPLEPGRATGINPAAWLCWLAGVTAIPLVSRNPLYLTLVLLVVIVVHVTRPAALGAARAWRLFAIVGTSAAVLSIGFNVLTVHVGDRPFAELPAWLPIIGGALTWNAAVYGLSSALAIATLVFAAATFNSAVRPSELIRLLPASLTRFGVAGSIALTFVPVTLSAAREVYDAQRARGQQFRRPGAALALLSPLLSVSLERAVTLSEALETRGFGAAAAASPAPFRRLLLPAGVVGLTLAALAVIALGYLLLGLGLLVAAGAAALFMPATPVPGRTRLRPICWEPASVVVAVSSAAPVCLVAASFIGVVSLNYAPFPRLEMPPFSLLAGLAVLPLLAPAFWSQQ